MYPALLLRRLGANGMVFPYWTYREALAEKVGLPLACAVLTMETSGGHMVYGHDQDRTGRCPGWGWGQVTKANYALFKHLRQTTGRSNGVGAMQLTSPGLQDEADRLGGCWVPRWNIAVGLRYVHEGIRAHGLEAGIASYNGSGPAAQRYARNVLALAEHFKSRGCGTLVGIWN